MRIDETHRVWLVASVLILGAATAIYVLYALAAPHGPNGGSPIGLVFGILGFSFMIFAGLLGARKKVPVWRLGRAQAWMRGHLWLGLLALPLILFHGGFHFGGPLTSILLWLLIITVLSGVYGAILQHYLPRVMFERVPMESIYDEIERLRSQLRGEAEGLIQDLVGQAQPDAEEVAVAAQAELRAGGFTAMRPRGGASVQYGLSEEEIEPVKAFYDSELLPFLNAPSDTSSRLADETRANAAFTKLRMLVPPVAHPAIANLESVCEEERQLTRQVRLHRLLHVWLLLHIPLSLALLLLSVFHAIIALRY
ncbi:MAG TPA: hypothetical protein VKG84_10480 [Candidatus Acidoferrales bacterium]|nr:hypothetical protein [Candidatus Acidoferrales bacterium]